MTRGDKEQSTERVESEADEDTSLVRKSFDKKGSGDGHHTVTAVKRKLNERTLEITYEQNVFKRRYHRIGDVIGKSPQ